MTSMTMRLTKRQFLRLIGSAAGVAATYHTMNTLGLLGPETAQAATPDLAGRLGVREAGGNSWAPASRA